MICDRTASNTVSAAANGLSRVLARNNVISIIVFPEPRRVRVGKGRRFQGGANRRRNSMTITMDTFRQHPSARKTSHPFPPLRGGLLRRPAYLMLGEANRGTASDGADRTYTDGPRAPSVPGRRRRQRQPLNPHCPQHLRHAHREHLYAGPTRYGIPWLTVCSSSTWKRKRTAPAPLCHT